MAVEPGMEWVGTPLDTDDVEPGGIEEIVAEFDEGEEILTPKLNELFGSYDLHEAANYIHYLSGHIVKGREQIRRERGDDRLHGIEVSKRKADGLGDPGTSGVRIRRISVRYEDGRVMSFIPEAEEEYFSQDDAERVVGILRKSSSALEWGRMPDGYPAPERGGGLVQGAAFSEGQSRQLGDSMQKLPGCSRRDQRRRGSPFRRRRTRSSKKVFAAYLMSRWRRWRRRGLPLSELISGWDPTEEIVYLAEELDVGAVVVDSRGLGAIEQLAMASVSESVVRHAHCSVLVACAEGQGT